MASCKPFEVEFSISAQALYNKVCDLIQNNNGHMAGSQASGTFSVPVSSFGRVSGDYAISEGSIALTIKKRPLLLSCSVIESYFRKNLPRLEQEHAAVFEKK